MITARSSLPRFGRAAMRSSRMAGPILNIRTAWRSTKSVQLIAEVTEAIRRHEGKPPGGWMSPGANPSANTEDLLAEAGYRYTLDWPMDDQPVWMKTKSGPLLSVPYPHEVNDVPMVVLHDGTAQRIRRHGHRQFR